MQETKRPDGKIHREYFANFDSEKAKSLMDERLQKLEDNGHRIVGRRTVGWNEPCPCDSGKKFKRCCGRGLR